MLIHGDCLVELKKLEADSVHCLVTDPPAGIGFMSSGSKDHWDSDKGGRDSWIAWMTEVMVECLRVLKPGAHGFVWSIPRTSHWTMTALENAGFEIRDVIVHTYASGFPKSHNISKAIDKKFGKEREVVARKEPFGREGRKTKGKAKFGVEGWETDTKIDITAPASEEAKKWDGYGSALKPAHEDWIVVRKPLSEKSIVDNVLKHGTGAINIDDCRVPYESEDPNHRKPSQTSKKGENIFFEGNTRSTENLQHGGRFPANLLVSDDVLNDGEVSMSHNNKENIQNEGGSFGGGAERHTSPNDSGSFSRYFSLDSWFQSKLKALPRKVQRTFPFLIVPKASKSEKNRGLSWKTEKEGSSSWGDIGAVEGNPRKPNTGHVQKRSNIHPTCKPLDLMSYLITLGSREGDTVLDPFLGSGTTAVAAKTLLRKYIGIEREEEYVKIAQARIDAVPQSLFDL